MIETLVNHKIYLKIASDNTDLDVELQLLADEVDETIKTFLRRDLEEATYTEYHDGNGKSEIVTRQFPITAVTSISVWNTETEEYDALVENTDYERIIIRPGGFSIFIDSYTFLEGIKNYEIVYVAGYSDTTMPKDIKLAAKKLMKIDYDESPLKDNYLGSGTHTSSGGGITNTKAIDLQAEEKILKKIIAHKAVNV